MQQREAHNFGAIAVVVEALLPYPSLVGLRPKKITATNAGMFDGGLQADYEKRRPGFERSTEPNSWAAVVTTFSPLDGLQQ